MRKLILSYIELTSKKLKGVEINEIDFIEKD